MKIGLLGIGNIGGTLARRLPTAGHEVKVANSRGPETIDTDLLATGAQAVTADEAVQGVDVVILSVPFSALPEVAATLSQVPAETVVLDTSNYYPNRDGRIEALENGQAESEWVAEQLGRPVVKAWNAVGAPTFAEGDRPAGDPDRVALPIAGDDAHAKVVASRLVDDSGFDPVDAGSLADSWRQQPGSPVYCTALTAAEIPDALAGAERDRLPTLREFAAQILIERMEHPEKEVDAEYGTQLSRMIYM